MSQYYQVRVRLKIIHSTLKPNTYGCAKMVFYIWDASVKRFGNKLHHDSYSSNRRLSQTGP
jgi:hypothetical protein